MERHKKWIARIVSLLVLSLLFVLMNYVFTIKLGGKQAQDLLKDENIRKITQVVKDSGVEYRKIGIIINSEQSQPMSGFFVFAFLLNAFVVSVYAAMMTIMKKIFRFDKK